MRQRENVLVSRIEQLPKDVQEEILQELAVEVMKREEKEEDEKKAGEICHRQEMK